MSSSGLPACICTERTAGAIPCETRFVSNEIPLNAPFCDRKIRKQKFY